MASYSKTYQQLSQDDLGNPTDNAKSSWLRALTRTELWLPYLSTMIWRPMCLIYAANFSMFFFSLIVSYHLAFSTHNHCLQATSAFSPILSSVDLRMSLRSINGALRDNTSIWRQPPSAEVDAAWDAASAEDMQLVTVSSQDILRAGKDPLVSVRAPTSWGLGDDAFIAQVEVYHQIHCLNELRKELYYDYYYQTPHSELHLSHKSHCIHMLLQTLMCNADVGIVTHTWIHDEGYVEPKTRPYPDFNVIKKCRDYDALTDWLRSEGGVKNLSDKFPMQYPGNVPVINTQGYSNGDQHRSG